MSVEAFNDAIVRSEYLVTNAGFLEMAGNHELSNVQFERAHAIAQEWDFPIELRRAIAEAARENLHMGRELPA